MKYELARWSMAFLRVGSRVGVKQNDPGAQAERASALVPVCGMSASLDGRREQTHVKHPRNLKSVPGMSGVAGD